MTTRKNQPHRIQRRRDMALRNLQDRFAQLGKYANPDEDMSPESVRNLETLERLVPDSDRVMARKDSGNTH